MRIRSVLVFTFMVLAFLPACTLNYIKDEDLKALDREYEGVFVCIKEIDSGNNVKLPVGTRVRLYFHSGTNSVKVYAYDIEQPRENALGKLVLYMFDTDFPDSKFMKELLAKKLAEIVKKVE